MRSAGAETESLFFFGFPSAPGFNWDGAKQRASACPVRNGLGPGSAPDKTHPLAAAVTFLS